MNRIYVQKALLVALAVSVSSVTMTSAASPIFVDPDQHQRAVTQLDQSGFLQLAQKRKAGGAKAGGRKAGGRKAGGRKAAPAKKRPPAASRPAAPAGNKRVNKDVEVNVDKNVNVNVDRNVRVTRRPAGWRGRHWGAVVFGVTLGTIIVVAASTPPPPPDPSLCWTWTNDALTEGYWYYCDGE